MSITLEQQKANRKLWVEALRSGKYEQGMEALCENGRFCCLGVACVVAGEKATDLALCGTLRDFPEVKAFFGLQTDIGDFGSDALSSRNDHGDDFTAIANIIESEPPGLFVESVESAS